MHHGQSRGETKYIKVCKRTREFFENTGEICKNRRRNNNRGHVPKQEIGRKFKICGRRLTKRSSDILADENRKICRENVKLGKSFIESEKAFENRGKSETRGKCI